MSLPFSRIRFDIKAGKTALVTGGSSGIGLETARILASHGLNVWIIARQKEQLDRAQQILEDARINSDQHIQAISADVSDWNRSKEVVSQVTETSGSLDLLINSAGVVQPGYVQELDEDVFKWMIDVNYYGVVNYTKAALPIMLDNGSGYIVQVSSLGGVIGIFGYTAYAGAKYAVRGFTDALRSELKPYGIGVSIAFPVDTNTPQLAYEDKFKPPETKYMTGQAKINEPDEIASLIIKNIKKGKYQIIPGGEPWLLYKLSNILGAGRNHIIDWLVYQAQRNGNP